jgi:hypothetical protein
MSLKGLFNLGVQVNIDIHRRNIPGLVNDDFMDVRPFFCIHWCPMIYLKML